MQLSYFLTGGVPLVCQLPHRNLNRILNLSGRETSSCNLQKVYPYMYLGCESHVLLSLDHHRTMYQVSDVHILFMKMHV